MNMITHPSSVAPVARLLSLSPEINPTSAIIATSTSISTGTIVWLAARPLIRLLICLFFGFILTKRSLFPPVVAKSIAQILINVLYPCLLFSKIIPAFNHSNVQFIGPLVLVAIVYGMIGITLAWIIKQICWVPHRFRYGFLVAGCWANIGDIPTAVLLSLTSTPPFNKSTDPDLVVAYLSVFIIVLNTTLFSCGGHKLVAMDFTGPDVDPNEDRELMRTKRIALFQSVRHRIFSTRPADLDPEQPHEEENKPEKPILTHLATVERSHHGIDVDSPTTCVEIAEITEINSPSPTVFDAASPLSDTFPENIIQDPSKTVHFDVAPTGETPISPPPLPPSPVSFKTRLHGFLGSLFSPPSLAIMISIPISLTLPLKALFLPLQPNSHIVMPNLPDGQPPLFFLLDTAQFIGAGAVPLGLICLGSALSRLRIPTSSHAQTSTPFHKLSRLSNLPLSAITLLALSKLVLLPVLATLIIKTLISHGIISKDDKVLCLVCMFCACLPTSTTQVYLTQIYSGTGTAEWLVAFLVPQYLLMTVTMTVYTGFVLKLLFG